VFHGANSLLEIEAETTLLAQTANDVSAHLKVGDTTRLCWPVAETFAFPDPGAGA
jgi:hypothetical protein